MDDRLYVIVHRSLSPAQKAVQGMHAVASFAGSNPGDYSQTTLVFLESDSPELFEGTAFYEPDLDNRLTAVCFLGKASKRVRALPLALSESS